MRPFSPAYGPTSRLSTPRRRALASTTTGFCDSCGEVETRDHFLYACPAYDTLRTRLTRQLGARRLPRPSILLTTTTFARPLLRFITASGRFPTLHQAVEATEDAGADARPRRMVQARGTRVREEEQR
ncbi:hypothetical protein JCM10207_001371 [Rhodosporidiobolus poonsookiae]